MQGHGRQDQGFLRVLDVLCGYVALTCWAKWLWRVKLITTSHFQRKMFTWMILMRPTHICDSICMGAAAGSVQPQRQVTNTCLEKFWLYCVIQTLGGRSTYAYAIMRLVALMLGLRSSAAARDILPNSRQSGEQKIMMAQNGKPIRFKLMRMIWRTCLHCAVTNHFVVAGLRRICAHGSIIKWCET